MLNLVLAILAALLPACADESADNCYWDAQAQGNGQGSSFIVIDGWVTYLD